MSHHTRGSLCIIPAKPRALALTLLPLAGTLRSQDQHPSRQQHLFGSLAHHLRTAFRSRLRPASCQLLLLLPVRRPLVAPLHVGRQHPARRGRRCLHPGRHHGSARRLAAEAEPVGRRGQPDARPRCRRGHPPAGVECVQYLSHTNSLRRRPSVCYSVAPPHTHTLAHYLHPSLPSLTTCSATTSSSMAATSASVPSTHRTPAAPRSRCGALPGPSSCPSTAQRCGEILSYTAKIRTPVHIPVHTPVHTSPHIPFHIPGPHIHTSVHTTRILTNSPPDPAFRSSVCV